LGTETQAAQGAQAWRMGFVSVFCGFSVKNFNKGRGELEALGVGRWELKRKRRKGRKRGEWDSLASFAALALRTETQEKGSVL